MCVTQTLPPGANTDTGKKIEITTENMTKKKSPDRIPLGKMVRGLKDGTFVNTVSILDKTLIVCKAGGGRKSAC